MQPKLMRNGVFVSNQGRRCDTFQKSLRNVEKRNTLARHDRESTTTAKTFDIAKRTRAKAKRVLDIEYSFLYRYVSGRVQHFVKPVYETLGLWVAGARGRSRLPLRHCYCVAATLALSSNLMSVKRIACMVAVAAPSGEAAPVVTTVRMMGSHTPPI